MICETLNTLTIEHCFKVFTWIEGEAQHLVPKNKDPDRSNSIRGLNDLLKRVSKSTKSGLSARVQFFISALFPLSTGSPPLRSLPLIRASFSKNSSTSPTHAVSPYEEGSCIPYVHDRYTGFTRCNNSAIYPEGCGRASTLTTPLRTISVSESIAEVGTIPGQSIRYIRRASVIYCQT